MSTPNNNQQPIVLENRFREVAEQVLAEAKEAAAVRDDLDREIAPEAAADRTDAAEQERLERELEQVQQRRALRASWLAERLTRRQAAAGEAVRLEAEGRRAHDVIEQMSNSQPVEGERPVVASGVYPVPTRPMPTLVDGDLPVQDGAS
ncbi:MAG: hypothetical protein ACRDP6_32795 [Actinoallomurus sp.]